MSATQPQGICLIYQEKDIFTFIIVYPFLAASLRSLGSAQVENIMTFLELVVLG